MKHSSFIKLSVLIAITILPIGCKEKKTSDDIIVEKVVEKKPTAPATMSDYTDSKTVEWSGSTYTISVTRKADTDSASMVKTDEGKRYYNNTINVEIVREDGSEFFARKFTKDFFSTYLPDGYLGDNVLTGIVFDKAEAGRLLFVASVGSPDALSDEYIPMRMAISRTGQITVERTSDMDLN